MTTQPDPWLACKKMRHRRVREGENQDMPSNVKAEVGIHPHASRAFRIRHPTYAALPLSLLLQLIWHYLGTKFILPS